MWARSPEARDPIPLRIGHRSRAPPLSLATAGAHLAEPSPSPLTPCLSPSLSFPDPHLPYLAGAAPISDSFPPLHQPGPNINPLPLRTLFPSPDPKPLAPRHRNHLAGVRLLAEAPGSPAALPGHDSTRRRHLWTRETRRRLLHPSDTAETRRSDDLTPPRLGPRPS